MMVFWQVKKDPYVGPNPGNQWTRWQAHILLKETHGAAISPRECQRLSPSKAGLRP